jgi:hypothetical protein
MEKWTISDRQTAIWYPLLCAGTFPPGNTNEYSKWRGGRFSPASITYGGLAGILGDKLLDAHKTLIDAYFFRTSPYITSNENNREFLSE